MPTVFVPVADAAVSSADVIAAVLVDSQLASCY
jgi:hypothetical protein